MHLEFSGAAREVTGSCHILRVGDKTVLLDCGMFQGKRADASAKNHKLPLPVEQIDAIVLSHAHIDHSGRLPYLVANGYGRQIICTPATRDLCAYMLRDSAHIQEKDAEYLARRTRKRRGSRAGRGGEDMPVVGEDDTPPEPLYGTRDAIRTLELMVSVPYDRTVDVVPGVRATFVDAGHILGSASVIIECEEAGKKTRLVFSADIGRAGLPIIRDPVPPQRADVIVMESTYGNRDHEPVSGAREHLARTIRETAARGGRVLIPAFAVGRAQEIIYDLHSLVESGQIPAIPVYVDSPLAVDITTVFETHPELFDQGEDVVRKIRELFRFDLLRYVREAEDSKKLNTLNGPMIVIAASGMAESGRIVHHLIHGAPDRRNTILVVGFMAEHTLGRRIVERRPTLKIMGEEVPLEATVEIINGYSAHADRGEQRLWLDQVGRSSPGLRAVHLVHGEPEAQDALTVSLRAAGYQVDAPSSGEQRPL